MRFWLCLYGTPDRFDWLSKSRLEIGGFAVCVVRALGIYELSTKTKMDLIPYAIQLKM